MQKRIDLVFMGWKGLIKLGTGNCVWGIGAKRQALGSEHSRDNKKLDL